MRDNLNEWMIECGDFTQMKSPKQRLLFNLLKNIYVVYSINKIKKSIPNESSFIDQTRNEDKTIKKVILTKSTSNDNDNDDELLIN